MDYEPTTWNFWAMEIRQLCEGFITLVYLTQSSHLLDIHISRSNDRNDGNVALETILEIPNPEETACSAMCPSSRRETR